MQKYFILFFILSCIKATSQEKISNSQMITFSYSYQLPIGELSNNFGHNSSLGVSYFLNKNKLLYGVDANFIFGNNLKNDSILHLISTDNGYLINASGELDQVLLSERGFNAHVLFGKSFHFHKKNLTGIYIYGGIGYLQHKIKIESDRTTLPQIDENYIKGYDNLTSGLSSKICLDYMYFDKSTYIKFYMGYEMINALTRNKRAYNFSEMHENQTNLNLDQLFGVRFGIIIPINRINEENFHYR